MDTAQNVFILTYLAKNGACDTIGLKISTLTRHMMHMRKKFTHATGGRYNVPTVNSRYNQVGYNEITAYNEIEIFTRALNALIIIRL